MVFTANGNYTQINPSKWKWGLFTVNYLNPPRRTHGIVLVTNGKATFKSDKNTLEATVGDIIFLPKDSCYYAYMQQTENYLVNFENDNIKETAPLKLFGNADRKFYEYFDEAIDMQIKNESELLQKSRFYRFIDLINKEIEGICGENSIMKKAKKLLDDNYNLSITDVAKECAISESGLRKNFKEIYGISPMEYKIKVKINKAKFLLEATSLSTTEISEKLGFYDTACFSKTFKKHIGCSPSNYIKDKSL